VRDSNISFKEYGHIYTIKECKKNISVTTWVKNKFEKFDAENIINNMMESPKWIHNKYYGMTKDEIKKLWKNNGSVAAELGTKMHKMFENHYNDLDIKDELKTTIEYEYFMNFLKDYPDLVPYRSEWMIYDETRQIAGSVDMIFINPDKSVSIYDWKRCKSIDKFNNFNKYSIDPDYSTTPDTNFWHYTLQLNMYKTILEDKYGLSVSELYLVCIHPDLHNTYKKIEVPFVTIK